ncbi:MAG: 30S ribosomal protein S12 methylthiotransferase RimO [Flavobacteriales bacterium]|nr:30S ribosomal protein S12 methylthiotransferase RimO [Flavobacteriales bacterium]MDW8410268.1 30S ribosomal protein S12 methylthiotransferase RimO [Flavobacteriales bacterium]
MRVRTAAKPRINVITLGCAKNLFDSEVLMGHLRASGFEVTHDNFQETYDVVVVNTCGFIEAAKAESIQTILEFAQLRQKGLIQKLIVTGCLSERYRSELREEIPEVDAWFGTRELPQLLKSLKADYRRELIGERLLTTPSHYAYLKISEGCNRPCSFCSIPKMRGRHVSRPLEELHAEAVILAQKGVKELIIIAQDSTYYGVDLYGRRMLARLLDTLCQVEGLAWIRLHYAYPAGFPDDVLEVMASQPKICKYLDLPLQHIHDDILRSMRRGLNGDKTRRLLDHIRRKVPDIALRTTFIVGYPGEKDHHFETLCRFVEEQRFHRVGVFTYSHEEQTAAFSLPDDVPPAVKEARAQRLMEIQQDISLQHNCQLIGKKLKVLVDRNDGHNSFARTEYDSPEVDNEVLLEGHPIPAGTFLTVEITDAAPYDLYARPLA